MASTATEQIDSKIVATEKIAEESPKKKEICPTKTQCESNECVENGKESSPKKVQGANDKSAAADAEEEEKNGDKEENGVEVAPLAKVADEAGHNDKEEGAPRETNGTSPVKSSQKKTLSEHQSDVEEPSPKKLRKSLELKPTIETEIGADAKETPEEVDSGKPEAMAACN